MKKTIIIFGILLSLALVSAGIVSLSTNVKEAEGTIKTIDDTKIHSGDLTWLSDGSIKSCILDEDVIDTNDIARCMGCDYDATNGEIVCPFNWSNIVFDGEKLHQAEIEDRFYYDFDKNKLDIKYCNSQNLTLDSKSRECIDSNKQEIYK